MHSKNCWHWFLYMFVLDHLVFFYYDLHYLTFSKLKVILSSLKLKKNQWPHLPNFGEYLFKVILSIYILFFIYISLIYSNVWKKKFGETILFFNFCTWICKIHFLLKSLTTLGNWIYIYREMYFCQSMLKVTLQITAIVTAWCTELLRE